MTLPQSDRDFLKHHGPYFEQARMGFLHGMPPSALPHMEHLYRAHLDKNFTLTTWCSACVVDMMQRLSRWWEGIQQEEEAAALALQAAQDRANAITSADMDEIIEANMINAAGADALEAISAPLAAEEPAAEERPARKDNRPKSRRGRPKKEA